MKLTDEQISKLSSVLKFPEACPNCGTTELPNMSPDEYQLTSVDRNGNQYTLGGPMEFVPLVELHCCICGYTRLFNLKILGIVKD